MLLTTVVWPVYSLGTNTPTKEGSIVYFSKTDQKGKVSLELIDDKEVQGNSLALRRITLLGLGVPLYKIKHAFFFLSDLVKFAKPSNWFIDSTGKIFQYKKTRTAKLVFRKITKVVRGIGNSFIEVKGHDCRYATLYPPEPEQKYAGLLIVDGVYLLYGFFREEHKSTYRKI